MTVEAPPDEVAAPAGHGDSNTHQMASLPPGKIREDDIYQVGREFRTIAQVLLYRTGEIVVYFREPHAGREYRVRFPPGTPEVTVYRPREVEYDQ